MLKQRKGRELRSRNGAEGASNSVVNLIRLKTRSHFKLHLVSKWFYQPDKNGIIVCNDADCTCEPDYPSAIRDYFQSPHQAGLVYFEHSLARFDIGKVFKFALGNLGV
jgi:hypothetical protein